MKLNYAYLSLALLAPAWCLGQPNDIERKLDWWVANSNVRSMEIDEPAGLAYIGGDFTEIQPPSSTSYGCLLEASGEGWPVLRSPDPDPSVWFDHVRPNGIVRAVVSDGADGWYIGGDFTLVGGQPRLRLAHILGDGSVDPAWQSGTDGIVRALALHNGKLYVGGDFSNANQLRNRIAAFHAVPGVPLSEPNGYSNLVQEFNGVGHANNNQVRTIAASGNLLYVGGTFTTMGGATCNRLIALDASTGNATAWSPNANNAVNAIALTTSAVMVGGEFTQMNATARTRFAELDITTGALNPFNPGANNDVHTLVISGDTLFAGGAFTTFFGQTRKRLASVKLTPEPVILDWDPEVDNGSVLTLVVQSSGVFFAGSFTGVDNPIQTRYRLAAVDRAAGDLLAWDPLANGTIRALASSSAGIYCGGEHTMLGFRLRNRLAAIDLATGKPTSFTASVNNTVYAIELHAGNIYIGGSFTLVRGETRNRAAALDATGQLVALWQPNINNTVYTMAKETSNLYIGGSFTTISGFSRNRIASLDLNNGAVSTS